MAAKTASAGIRWHPRVRQDKIRAMYEDDARGLADPALIDDVGLALFLRCESLLLQNGNRVQCPACRQVFALPWQLVNREKQRAVVCPGCRNWECTGQQYLDSMRGDYLMASNALPFFDEFARSYPAASTPRERVLLIDRLIHQFHYALVWNPDTRAFDGRNPDPHAINGHNLIEGTHDEVLSFLDGLTYGAHNADTRQVKAEWLATVERMRATRRPKRAKDAEAA